MIFVYGGGTVKRFFLSLSFYLEIYLVIAISFTNDSNPHLQIQIQIFVRAVRSPQIKGKGGKGGDLFSCIYLSIYGDGSWGCEPYGIFLPFFFLLLSVFLISFFLLFVFFLSP